MGARRSIIVLALSIAALSASRADAQPVGAAGLLRVFVDCQAFFCDEDFLRTEIAFVDFVRVREGADVHVLGTAQQTGGGGAEHTLTFIGRGRFAPASDTLHFVLGASATPDERRRAIARAMQLGLVRFAAQTSVRDRLTVSYDTTSTKRADERGAHDPWKLWVFSVSGNGNFNAEEAQRFENLGGDFRAGRTTERWKAAIAANGSYAESRFELSDGVFNSYSHTYGARAFVARSVGAHWAIGPTSSVSTSTYLNQRAAYRIAPALEYDIFPYADATRRQLTILYSIGADHYRYVDTTIFGKVSESKVDHVLRIASEARQPWGSISASLEGAQFLDDRSKNRVVLGGGVSVRLFKGMSLDLFGNASRVHDQISLAKSGATDEEILVRQRQLATSFQYFAFVGLRYTFGSIFNNIVNPRFNSIDNGNGGFTIMF